MYLCKNDQAVNESCSCVLGIVKEQKTLRDALLNKVDKVQEERNDMAAQVSGDDLKLRDFKDLISDLERECLNLENDRFLVIKKLQEQETTIS